MNLFLSFHQYLKSQPNISLLTNQESTALKGLLILLVVLGHNTYLMVDMFAYKFLYAFHVYAFFYLPFLYNHKEETISHCVIKNILRLYVPYTFAFVLLLGIYLKTNSAFNFENIFFAYITGNPNHFLKMGGFLWFIPTLFSLLLIKQLYYRGNLICRYLLLVLSCFCLICFSFGYLGSWQIYQPFRCMTAFAMLFPAVISRFFIKQSIIKFIDLYFFFFVIIAFIIYPGNHFFAYTILNRFILPIVIFLFLYNQREKLVRFKFLQRIGRYSFPIYVFHIFIYQCCYWLIGNYMGKGTLCLGILAFVFTFSISYLVAKVRVVRFLFPH